MGPSPRELGLEGLEEGPRGQAQEVALGSQRIMGRVGSPCVLRARVWKKASVSRKRWLGWTEAHGPFIGFSTNIAYDYEQMNNIPSLGLCFLCIKWETWITGSPRYLSDLSSSMILYYGWKYINSNPTGTYLLIVEKKKHSSIILVGRAQFNFKNIFQIMYYMLVVGYNFHGCSQHGEIRVGFSLKVIPKKVKIILAVTHWKISWVYYIFKYQLR